MTKQELINTLGEEVASTTRKKKNFLVLHWALLLSSIGVGGWATILAQAEEPQKLLTAIFAAATTGLATLANQTSFKKKYQSYRTARVGMEALLLDVQHHDDVSGDSITKLKTIKLELAAGG